MNLPIRPLALALLAAAVTALALARPAEVRPSSAGTRSTMTPTSALAKHWQRGVSVRAWGPDEFAGAASDEALRALRATGSTTAVFIVPWYMTDATSTVLARGPETPTDASLRHAIATARRLGLAVVLKPHVEVLDGTFRGAIAPRSVPAWFAAYRAFVQHYADLARAVRAPVFVVGTELTSMSRHSARWRALIDGIRARFPGRLTFAANHLAGARQIDFWDALDLVGIDAYMSLATTDPNPTVDELVQAWTQFTDERGTTHRYVDEVTALRRQTGKPVMFTELGYRSAEGAATRPWEWTSTQAGAQEPQARAYEAAFRVWSTVPWFHGIYWWDWHAGWFDATDSGYNPRGKLAEGVLRRWHSG